MRMTRDMKAFPRAVLGVLAAFAAAACLGLAPEPDPVPRRWELGLAVGPLRVTTIDSPEEGEKSYFYLTYRVVNTSGEDLLFAPIWEVSSGRGPAVRSGRGVPMSVTRQLMDASQNLFIEDQISIVGTILQGEDNAKDGIVIWPANEMEGDKLTVYAAGFSGETAAVLPPGATEKTVLRKTLMLDYATPGSLEGQGGRPLPVREKRWIMR